MIAHAEVLHFTFVSTRERTRVEEKKNTFGIKAMEDHIDDLADFEVNGALLAALAGDRFTRIFVDLNLASGKLPEALKVGPRRSLREKDSSLVTDHSGGDEDAHGSVEGGGATQTRVLKM